MLRRIEVAIYSGGKSLVAKRTKDQRRNFDTDCCIEVDETFRHDMTPDLAQLGVIPYEVCPGLDAQVM